MHLKLGWALYAAILIPGTVLVNVEVKEQLKEWELKSLQWLPFSIPASSS
jgi:hypothetical protein